jgi:sugar phosphate permease
MGIVDALMLGFLGIGHFLHTLRPIKKPVKSLFVAMMLCSLSYGLIPFCTYVHSLSNIYVVSLLMCFNGYLQSYTWPNLLMVIHSKFPPEIYTVSLGFWATNANVGNIIGFSIFLALGPP